MNNFCSNCGKELNENAVICVKCGASTNNNRTKVKQPGKGCGIASMVLGIISTFYSICALFIFICLLASGEYFLAYEKIILGFVFLIIPIILLIIGLPLGISSRIKLKNGINLTGILLNSISLILCALSILIICII